MTKTHKPTGDAAALVRKLWQYCNVLRDDGLSYPDYVEQLTYLLFLKMSDEQDGGPVPMEYGWRSLENLEAEDMLRRTSCTSSGRCQRVRCVLSPSAPAQ